MKEQTADLIIVGILFLSIFPLDVFADTIVLKNGKKITGVITREYENKIELETFYGPGMLTERFSREEIENVIKDSKENEKILKRYVEERKLAEEKEQVRREAKEEQRKILEELDKKHQIEQDRQEKMEQRKKAAEIEKKKEIERGKELETFNTKVDELKAIFKQKEMEDKAFRFGEITSYERYEQPQGVTKFDSEYCKVYYQGLFYNEGNIAKKNVIVIMSFYDSEGNWLARRSIYTTPVDIPPGGNGLFEISISKKFSFTTYEISAVWDY